MLAIGVLIGCGGGTGEGVSACRGPGDCPTGFTFCRADMRCWSTPDPGVDAAMGIDAYVSPATDAYVAPGTDAFVSPGTDAYSVPGTDAFVVPGTDAYLTPGSDAWTPDPDAYVLPPPDAYVPPATDAGPLPDTGGPCGGGPLLTFYRDADGDGHGATASGTAMRCGPGGGYVASNDDCDDASASRYPGNPEACNNVDDDCNGLVDGPTAAASCSLPNANATCSAGFCEIASCSSAAFGNCDGLDTNGCEVDVRVSAAHCGACGSACGAALGCTASVCETSAVVAVEGGEQIACALRANGRVACWGGSMFPFSAPYGSPSEVPGIVDATQLSGWGGPDGSVGSVNVMCVRRSGGSVSCWGTSSGNTLSGMASTTTPVAIPGLSDALSVDVGVHLVCALRSTGRVACWGGAFGVAPTTVGGIADATQIDVENDRGCARLASGAVSCWRTSTDAASVAGVTTATSVRLLSGYRYVRLGDGSTSISPVPPGFFPAGGDEFGFLNVSGFGDRCYRDGGVVRCQGRGLYGQIGNGAFADTDTTFAAALGISDAVDLAFGDQHRCVLRSTGAVYCWGRNDVGQLADGTFTGRASPVAVLGL
jgi:hypothetical protein